MTMKIFALAFGALWLAASPASALEPVADAPPPATPSVPVSTPVNADQPPPKAAPPSEKVAKADEPVCRYVPIDNSMIRRKVCH